MTKHERIKLSGMMSHVQDIERIKRNLDNVARNNLAAVDHNAICDGVDFIGMILRVEQKKLGLVLLNYGLMNTEVLRNIVNDALNKQVQGWDSVDTSVLD